MSLSELSSTSNKLHVPSIINNDRDIKTMRDFSAGANIITKTMLSCLSNALSLADRERFETYHRNWHGSNSTLAMFRYLPGGETAPPGGDRTVGHQQHTDIGSLTLLFSEQWGLQVQPPSRPGAPFEFVEPRPGRAVVNVGDSLRFASGHRLYSCVHQVVPFDAARERYSFAFFLRPEVDALVRDSEGRLVTAGQWHDEKYDVFAATHQEQGTIAPKTMLLGGMPEQVAQATAVS